MRPRLLALTALAGATLAALALAPAAHAATGDNYVALGDSYSSGVGAGSYTSESGSCDRSLSAYPALWANANAVSSFTFAACSGATTADVANSQLAGLSSATSLVSITIGGNDENFSSIMEDCNLYSDSTCVSEIQAAEDDARANLPGKLASLFGQISARAPYARVVVLDYPHFYDLANDCIGLSQTKRTKIDEGIDVLDAHPAELGGVGRLRLRRCPRCVHRTRDLRRQPLAALSQLQRLRRVVPPDSGRALAGLRADVRRRGRLAPRALPGRRDGATLSASRGTRMADTGQSARTRLAAVLLSGVGVAAAIAIYAKAHQPALRPLFLLGFCGMLQMKAWLATVAVVLVVVQLLSALAMWGRLPGVPSSARWLGPVHRWSGSIAFAVSSPSRALRVVTGLRDDHAARAVAQHLGCAFYGAYAAKMVGLRMRGAPRLAAAGARRTHVHRVRAHLADVGVVVLHPVRVAADMRSTT